MKIDKQMLEKDIEQWKSFYNNYDNLAIGVLADVLGYFKADKRQEMVDSVLGVLESVKEPINGEIMAQSIKSDLESFERINNEATIAMRTLQWVKDISTEEENIEEKTNEEA